MQEFDLVIVGGGPAGIAAATTAGNHGIKVLLIDERTTLGGQIYKRVGPGFQVKKSIKLGADYLRGEKLIDSLNATNVEIRTETTVFSIEDSQVIITTSDNQYECITYKKILITPGAYDRPVFAANVICHIPDLNDLIQDAIAYQFHLVKSRIKIGYGRIIIKANGTDKLESITFARVDKNWNPIPGTEKTVIADTLCIGYGFFPSVELFKLLNCQMSYDENRGGTIVKLDEWGATSAPNVFGAGDGTGVWGSYVAMLNGQLAALKVVQQLDVISEEILLELSKKIRQTVNRRKKFQKAISNAYAMKPGIYNLASDETIICRCESIPLITNY